MEFAELRSSIEQVAWPAVPAGTAAQLLALQYQLDATQWWPAEQLRLHQFGQLQVLLRHAAATVPFHAERLRHAGIDPHEPLTEAAWARLPILTRRDVRDAGDLLHASSIPASHGATGETTTGGSTGIPVRVRRSAVDTLTWSAVAIREEIWHRDDMLGFIVRVRASPAGLTEEQRRQVRTADGLQRASWGPPAALLWQTGRSAILDYTTPVSRQAEFLRRMEAMYLFTVPSNLRLLLSHCRDNHIVLPDLRAVWTISEVVDGSLRKFCHDIFGVRIVSNYSAAETGYIALQCPDHDHYHVQSEVIFVEVLNDAGDPCAPGEIGRVVITPLHNFAMPLLRYELGDEAEVGAPCPCGRGLPVLRRVVGRTFDFLTLPSGEKRRPILNHYRLAEVAAIREFQIVQRSLHQIEVLMVLGCPLSEEEKATITAVLAGELGGEFDIVLTPCEAIPRTAAGKLRPFISDLPRV